jgi:hypothetical protein
MAHRTESWWAYTTENISLINTGLASYKWLLSQTFSMLCRPTVIEVNVRGCIQKFPDWVKRNKQQQQQQQQQQQ